MQHLLSACHSCVVVAFPVFNTVDNIDCFQPVAVCTYMWVYTVGSFGGLLLLWAHLQDRMFANGTKLAAHQVKLTLRAFKSVARMLYVHGGTM